MNDTMTSLSHGLSSFSTRVGPFPAHMHLLETAEGLVLWSPIHIDETMAERIAELGPVHALVAPNLHHHKFLAEVRALYPDAKLVLPAGMDERKAGAADATLPTVLSKDLELIALAGAPSMEETVAFHVPSRTLVLTDLLFNVRRADSFMQWLVFRWVSGTLGKAAVSRLWRRFVRDREAFATSIEALLDWPFERIVVAHGEPIESNAKDALVSALRARGLLASAAVTPMLSPAE